MSDLKEGIYLQKVTTKIGTGVTSSQREVENYYALRPLGDGAEVFLLNDNLELTGLREKLGPSELDGFTHRPDLQERYLSLAAGLGPGAARPKPSSSPPPPEGPAQSGAQTAPQAAGSQPADSMKKQASWWESTRLGAESLLKGK